MRIQLSVGLAISMAITSACSDDESTDDGEGGSGDGSDAGSDSDGNGGTADGSGTGGGGGGTGNTGTTGDGGSGTGDGTSGGGDGTCGDEACDVGQICVLPCCGGAPGCYPADADGQCQPGDSPIDAADCMAGCDVDPCCEATCEPPPPYCINEGDLVCGGEIPDQCSTPNGDCYGTKVGNELQCTCG